jgi:hypothetical protein
MFRKTSSSQTAIKDSPVKSLARALRRPEPIAVETAKARLASRLDAILLRYGPTTFLNDRNDVSILGERVSENLSVEEMVDLYQVLSKFVEHSSGYVATLFPVTDPLNQSFLFAEHIHQFFQAGNELLNWTDVPALVNSLATAKIENRNVAKHDSNHTYFELTDFIQEDGSTSQKYVAQAVEILRFEPAPGSHMQVLFELHNGGVFEIKSTHQWKYVLPEHSPSYRAPFHDCLHEWLVLRHYPEQSHLVELDSEVTKMIVYHTLALQTLLSHVPIIEQEILDQR